jgi:antitoxin CptB
MQKQDIESMLQEPAKIKWACRRGMLELDVLLSNFLGKGYNALDDENKRLFIDLLYLPDPELFALLMLRVEAPNAALAQLIARIREYART